MRPGVELGLGADEGADGEWSESLERGVEGVDEFGALLYFLGCSGGEVRVVVTVNAEPDTDVSVAFLRFSGKGRPVDGVGVDENTGEDDGIGVDVVVVDGFELSVVLIDVRNFGE